MSSAPAQARAGGEPTFSIVLSTYRRPELLRRALASALSQTRHDFEILVIDDAAEEAARRVVEEMAGDDPRVRYLARAEQGGVGRARNTGIEQARGRWVTILDDDDELLPGMLAAVHERIECHQEPLGFLWCGIRMVRDTPRGEVPIEDRLWGPHFGRPAGAPLLTRRERVLAEYDAARLGAGFGFTIRCDLLREVGGWDPALVVAGETDLVLRLLAAGASFDAVPSAQVVVHRVAGETLSRTTPAAQRLASVARIVERNGALLAAHPHLEAKLWETLARELYRSGDRAGAWRLAGRLLRRHPWTGHAWRSLLLAAATRRRG